MDGSVFPVSQSVISAFENRKIDPFGASTTGREFCIFERPSTPEQVGGYDESEFVFNGENLSGFIDFGFEGTQTRFLETVILVTFKSMGRMI